MNTFGAKRETATATDLCPQITVTRQPPANLRENDLELFSHELGKTIPPTQLLRLDNVRITAQGILIRGGKILPESFAFPFQRDQWKTRSVIKLLGQSYLFNKVREIREEVVWLTDVWSTGYFHWLADVLSKLYVIRDLATKRIVLLPHAYANFDFVHASLKAFEVENVQFIGADEVVRCQTVLLPTPVAPSGHFRDDIIKGVRRELLGHFGSDLAGTGRRVYISRERAPKRRIANEAEVRAVLQKFDFETIQAEDLTFEDQVRLLSQARYLISNHGAGLTNMLFLNSGGSVLELRHQTDRINNCYFIFASALDLKYFYQNCEPLHPGEDPHTADLVVDRDELAQTITLMTGPHERD
jgi:Glycosyltransferase 61